MTTPLSFLTRCAGAAVALLATAVLLIGLDQSGPQRPTQARAVQAQVVELERVVIHARRDQALAELSGLAVARH